MHRAAPARREKQAGNRGSTPQTRTTSRIARQPHSSPAASLSSTDASRDRPPRPTARTHTQEALGDTGARLGVEQFGIFPMVFIDPTRTDLDKFVTARIGPLLDHDARHGTALVPTALALLEDNLSLKASKFLEIHPDLAARIARWPLHARKTRPGPETYTTPGVALLFFWASPTPTPTLPPDDAEQSITIGSSGRVRLPTRDRGSRAGGTSASATQAGSQSH